MKLIIKNTLIASAAICLSTGVAAQSRNFELGVQAMIDKAGTTDVYVTAKPLDTLGAPSVLKQVQMKSFDKAGTLRWTKNLSDVPATVTSNPALATSKFSYTDMQRGQPVQSQVLIQTSETVKTEVYKDKVPVLYRPDLVVTKLIAPEKVIPGQPFSVEAVIGEVKGDLGARDVRITLKDGANDVDAIEAIQVSRGGITSAVFKAKFVQPGTYTLTAQVTGSAPTEYDITNNTNTVSVTVEDPKTLASQGQLHHYTEDYVWTWKGVNSLYDEAWDYSRQQKYRNTSIWTQPNQNVVLTFPFKLDYHLGLNDTITLASGSGVDVPMSYSYTYDWWCGGTQYTQSWGQVSPAPHVFLGVVTWSWCGYEYTQASVYSYFSEYVYFSKAWRPSTGQVFYDYSNSYATGGEHHHTGVTSVQGRIVATDANSFKFGTSTMVSTPVAPYPNNYDSGVVTHSSGWYHEKREGTYSYGSVWFSSTPQ